MRNALALLPLVSLGLSGCLFGSSSSDQSACADGQQALHASDGRTLCVGLEAVAEAPFSEGFYTARVTHRVRITDADGRPIDIDNDSTITDVSHQPVMHMNSGHDHGTPHAREPEDSSDPANGLYDLVAYYSMPSGDMLGDWDYQVLVTDVGNTLAAHFQPQVQSVPVPDVFSARASNDQDRTKDMEGLVINRPYTVWLHAVRPVTGGHRLTVFVSTQDMTMMPMNGSTMMHMSFPEVVAGETELHDENGTAFTLDTVGVRASADGGATWVDLAHDGEGRYSGDLTGLTSGQRAEVQVDLVVNGLSMTANGNPPALGFVAP